MPAGRAGSGEGLSWTGRTLWPRVCFELRQGKLGRGGMTGRNGATARTGIAGLDDVLGGGFPRNHVYVVQGSPGAGKTTVGLQFLLSGRADGETGLYVSLSETERELSDVAASHGWSLDGIAVQEILSPGDSEGERDNTLFHPAEVELGETTRSIFQQVERLRPSRVVIDSLSEVRLLSENPLRYRRQIVALKQFFAGLRCTALLLDDAGSSGADIHLQTVSHGVLQLDQITPLYGAERRRLWIIKLRGVKFRGGYHDFKIQTGGLTVYPRLVAAEHGAEAAGEATSSGLAGLDMLLGGGIQRGTTVLIMGPAGTGKSAIAAQYAAAAAGRGENVALFTFDEGLGTLFARTDALGISLRRHVEGGAVRVQQINPAELSPGEFAHLVRTSVDEAGARMVIIDSLSGYYSSMPEEHLLSVQLHELFTFLRKQGVIVILTLPQHGFVGAHVDASFDVSYLADTVILMRYFETLGEIRKAISVVKKRSGRHESTIRELAMDDKGLRIGQPLRDFQGVLTGIPAFAGASGSLLQDRDGRSDR